MLPSLGNSITMITTPIMTTAGYSFKKTSHHDHNQQLPSITELVPELFERSSSKLADSYTRRPGSEPREYKGRCHESLNPPVAPQSSPSFLNSKRRRLSRDDGEDEERNYREKLVSRHSENHSLMTSRNRLHPATTESTPEPSHCSRRSSTLSSCETWSEPSRDPSFTNLFKSFHQGRKSPSLISTTCQSRSKSKSVSVGDSPHDSDTSSSSLREYQRSFDSCSLSSSRGSPKSYANIPQELDQELNDQGLMRFEARYLPRLPSLNLINPAVGAACTNFPENEYALESSSTAQSSRGRQSEKSENISPYLTLYMGNNSHPHSEYTHMIPPITSRLNHNLPCAMEFSASLRDYSAHTNNLPPDPFSSSPCRFNNDSITKMKPRRRRGNLPKDITDKLRAWFFSHLAHPYPTEDEKQQLMDATGLQMNQISNWYINARRRQLPAMAASARAEARV